MGRFFSNKKILFSLLAGMAILVVLLVIFLLSRGGDTPNNPDNGDSPFGNLGDGTRPTPNTGDQNTDGSTNTGDDTSTVSEKATLIQITTTSVIGFSTFQSAGVTFARFIDRATGHIFETGLQTVNPVMVSNVTIPRVQNTDWKGSSILFQYLRDDGATVRSFFGSLERSSSTEGLAGTIKGFFIDDNSAGVALRPDGGAVFSLFKSDGGASGVITDKVTKSRVSLFASPLSEWKAEWPATSTLLLTSKADPNATGIAFVLDAKSGAMRRLLSLQDLSTKPNNDLSRIAVSYVEAGGRGDALPLQSAIFAPSNGTMQTLPIVTISEKCVWSIKNTSTLFCFAPRSIPTGGDQVKWYQGKTSFSDNLWRIDANTGKVELLALPIADSRIEFDAIHPMLSDDEGYLLFQNKIDGTLFAYRLPTQK